MTQNDIFQITEEEEKENDEKQKSFQIQIEENQLKKSNNNNSDLEINDFKQNSENFNNNNTSLKENSSVENYELEEEDLSYNNGYEHFNLTAPHSRIYNTPFLRTMDFLSSVSIVQSLLNSLSNISLFRRWFHRHHRKLNSERLKNQLPWAYIIIVYFVVVCDALAITVVQPFLPEMCENRFKIKHEQVGTYVGIIVGVFSGSRFFSSFFIGHITDRFGRKLVLAFGLLISFVGTASFGLAPNVYVAILIRVIAGLLTSSISICRAILSDLSSGELIGQRAEVFAYLGASFALSRSFSSSLGGVTASIRNGPINPYLMACLIASTMPFLGFIMVSVFLPETHPSKINTPSQFLEETSPDHSTNITKENKSHDNDIDNHNSNNNNNNNNNQNSNDNNLENHNDNREKNKNNNNNNKKKSKKKNDKHTLMNGLRYICSSSVLVKLIVMSSIASFCNGGFLLCVTLIAATDITSRGFGFSPAEIGITFMLFGLFGFLFQVIFFRRISRYLGLRKQYIFGATSLASACVALPLAAFPLWIWGTEIQYKVAVWILMVPSCLLMSMGFMQVLPLLQTMIANSIEPSRQGLAQGTTQSVASLLRAFGPFVSGALLSLFVSIKAPMLVFFILGLLYAITAVMAPTLPSYLDAKKEDLQQLKEAAQRDDNNSLSEDENSMFELGDNVSSDNDHYDDIEIELASSGSNYSDSSNKV